MSRPLCNFCRTPLSHSFVDLGMAPLVSAYIKAEEPHQMERFFPLHAYVCHSCYLVQLPPSQSPEQIFGEYPYFSSISDSWLEHARVYVERMIDRFGYGPESHVVEVASNDGYLLKNFKEKGIPVLGVEPARNVAAAAQAAGIPTMSKFFGADTARALVAEGKSADHMIGNNVLAHVPDLNDFVAGLALLLKPGGVITIEFPHLANLIAENQFDQIFHEHASYLSFIVVEKLFAKHGLTLFDVEELPTHGGSLRIYARHAKDPTKPILEALERMRARELELGFDKLEMYDSFAEKVRMTKNKLLQFLIGARSEGHSVAGYGAPGKGCVLLNYCGIRSDFMEYTVDRSPHKQGYLMPGVRIPIHHPDKIRETKPAYLLILPWNLKNEIMEQMSFIREWGGKFVIPIPEVKVYP